MLARLKDTNPIAMAGKPPVGLVLALDEVTDELTESGRPRLEVAGDRPFDLGDVIPGFVDDLAEGLELGMGLWVPVGVGGRWHGDGLGGF
ncbi:hypothetical protein D3C86_1690890 [compost metagenome]